MTARGRRSAGAMIHRLVALFVLSGLVTGLTGMIVGSGDLADAAWATTTVVALAVLTLGVLGHLLRGRIGVDVIALLAMAGSLILGEYLAGAVIALMLSGGQLLEDHAARRANTELTALLERAPKVAHRYEESGLTTRDVEEIEVGDTLLVKPGEVVPVDALIASEVAILDESTLTGEARPAEIRTGHPVRSGSVNAGAPFDMKVTAAASESTYSGIVRLVEQSQRSQAPLVRLADRYAGAFLPLTILVAGAAWAMSGEPVRALAVLVVATPCPLILAAPIAIAGGMSRAARRGIVVKGGGALETLARGRILLFDKTGTLTSGHPRVTEVMAFGDVDEEEILRLAASLDQVSPHAFAPSIVDAARARGLELSFPVDVAEDAGSGLHGRVDGSLVRLGKAEWALGSQSPDWVRTVRRRTALQGSSNVFVSIDGVAQGALILEDLLRPEAPRTIRDLKAEGITRIVMVTGDHPEVAELVGAAVGVDRVMAERSPQEKLRVVEEYRSEGVTVMVGDGINDAPALAAADVGIALGARGAAAHSEAADVVITIDRLDRVVGALRISKHSRRIALQSVLAGMGMSGVAMLFAAGGWLSPVAGAFLQEAIDVAVILNALRALRDEKSPSVTREELKIAARTGDEHRRLLAGIAGLRQVADRMGEMNPQRVHEALGEVSRFLTEELAAHETREDRVLYPVVARVIGGEDPMGVMSRAHQEIAHLTRLFVGLYGGLGDGQLSAEDVRDLRRILYGLHAILLLHFAQEEEAYLAVQAGQPQRSER